MRKPVIISLSLIRIFVYYPMFGDATEPYEDRTFAKVKEELRSVRKN